RLDGKSGCRPVIRHERGPFRRWNDLIDVLEDPATALVDLIEQAKGTFTAVAQYEPGNRAAQLGIVTGQRFGTDTLLAHSGSEDARIHDRLAGPVRAGGIHRVG